MTFAIVVANADQVVQVNDRRLTADGQMVDDSSNKAGHAVCDDASFLYCFTGLARVGDGYITSRWLLDALYDAAQRSHKYRDIWHALAEEATTFFRSSPYLRHLSTRARRLTVMLTGYSSDEYIINALISNFQDFTQFIDYPEARDEFSVHAERSKCPAGENPTMIQAIGQFHALTRQDELELRQMIERRAPAEAIRQKAIALVQEISDRPQTSGAVGKKVTTARLQRLDPLVPVAGYASDEVEERIHLLDQVNLRSGAPKLLIADAQISAPLPVVFPRVHRNAPCPCGSGKKFRLCHGGRQR
jgi:SEC-C motif